MNMVLFQMSVQQLNWPNKNLLDWSLAVCLLGLWSYYSPLLFRCVLNQRTKYFLLVNWHKLGFLYNGKISFPFIIPWITYETTHWVKQLKQSEINIKIIYSWKKFIFKLFSLYREVFFYCQLKTKTYKLDPTWT